MRSQTDTVSTEYLLTYLGRAIDEAKLVRSIIKLKDKTYNLKAEQPFSNRLIHLNREAEYLESKLIQIRNRAKNDSI